MSTNTENEKPLFCQMGFGLGDGLGVLFISASKGYKPTKNQPNDNGKSFTYISTLKGFNRTKIAKAKNAKKTKNKIDYTKQYTELLQNNHWDFEAYPNPNVYLTRKLDLSND